MFIQRNDIISRHFPSTATPRAFNLGGDSRAGSLACYLKISQPVTYERSAPETVTETVIVERLATCEQQMRR